MKKLTKRFWHTIYCVHYSLTCMELWLWKQWADITHLVKHCRPPRKRTPKELREASKLLRKWLERDRKERR